MGQPTILVVDDQEHICQLLTVSLEICGYRVITARDGVDALKHLAQHPIDLLLTDWTMPEMGGEELSRYVRDKHPELPVVVISCSNTPLSKPECSALGILNWVRKPFRIKDIQNVVSDALNDAQPLLHRSDDVTCSCPTGA